MMLPYWFEQEHLDRVKDFFRELRARIDGDFVPLAAGSIAFFGLLSLIPLLLLATSIALSFIPIKQILVQISDIASTLGPQGIEALKRQVLAFIGQKGVLTGVASFIGLWTGSQVFIILESAINMVWDSTRKRPFWQRRALAIGMMVTVGTLLFGAILLTNVIRVLKELEIPLLGHNIRHLNILINLMVSYVVPALLVSSIFSLIYTILPTKKVTFRTVIPGALFAGVLWLISIHLFGWYVGAIAHGYQYFYGSLGGIVLLMLWFYYSSYIMIIGAEISATIHHRLAAAGDAEERQVDEEELPS